LSFAEFVRAKDNTRGKSFVLCFELGTWFLVAAGTHSEDRVQVQSSKF